MNSNSDLKHVSLRFYDYLCKVIGTEEVVQARRRILNALDNINDNQKISTGSRAEGLDLDGSDFDAMFVYQQYNVCENLGTLKNNYPCSLILVMDTTKTKSGFTRLKLVPGCIYAPCYLDLCKVDEGTIYLSSKKFRECSVDSFSEYTIHGPCVTWGDMSYEVANCLFCNHWVTEASDWIRRDRTGWPLMGTINAVVGCGTLFVPVGSKGSKYEEFEFRFSYSVAEKILVHSFNHVQLLCYALMKIVLKDILKRTHGEIICSYFIKTIMFWICEELSPSIWTPDRLLECFINCFKRLLYCVQHKTCLHYFIPENDLFDGRFKPNEQTELIETLQSLLCLDWQLLLQTETLSSFAQTLFSSTLCFTPYSSALPFLSFLENASLSALIDFNMIFKSCLKIRTRETRKLSVLTLNRLIVRNLSKCVSKKEGNKNFYSFHNKCLCHLLMGTQNDAMSGWLLVASLFYRCNQYRHCVQILQFCLQQLTPDKIVLDPPVSDGSQHLLNEKIMDAKRLTRQHSFSMARKLFTIETVRIQRNSFLFPTELAHAAGQDVNENSDNIVIISSLSFAEFLSQLCQERSVLSKATNINTKFSVINVPHSPGNACIL